MTPLLDTNVLVALVVAEHEHHDVASAWVAQVTGVAVCPVVEGALVRYLVRTGESVTTARAVLTRVRCVPRVAFWPDDLSYADADLARVHGHRQVTDAYLVALAVAHGSCLATLDRALAATWPDASVLLA